MAHRQRKRVPKRPTKNGKRAQDSRPRPPAGLASRNVAVHLLGTVLVDRTTLDVALDKVSKTGSFADLSGRDRAFARMIVMTTLRRLGQIDDILGQFIARSLPKECGRLREILRAAAAQLLFLDTPSHAVIDIAVRQVQGDRRARRFDKLTNAVLRRMVREGSQIRERQDATRLNTPDWLWERWLASYGVDATREIAAVHLNEPALDLTVKSDPAGWAERLGGLILPSGTVRLQHRGRIEELEGYGAGAWWVQDIAAALPVRSLGELEGLRVADLCAAPGGKTAQLLCAGAEVVTVDSSAMRIERLRENLARLELSCEVIEADVAEWRTAEPFDVVILDAPCTATGTIRRHPDIVWLKSEDDVARSMDLQKRLLDNAIELVRPGGRLVYCTCSLEAEECSQQIVRLLGAHTGLERVAVRAGDFGGEEAWVNELGELRTLPFQLPVGEGRLTGMDGFFAAVVRRRA